MPLLYTRILFSVLQTIKFYRDERESYSSTDRKYTSKIDLANNCSTSHSRTTTQASQWAEQDSNNSGNQSTTSSSSAEKSTNNNNNNNTSTCGRTATHNQRDIEAEAAAHLLTVQEKTLCLQLDMKPTQYLTQKSLLLQVIIICCWNYYKCFLKRNCFLKFVYFILTGASQWRQKNHCDTSVRAGE